jgi:hypothetical protein
VILFFNVFQFVFGLLKSTLNGKKRGVNRRLEHIGGVLKTKKGFLGFLGWWVGLRVSATPDGETRPVGGIG